MKMDVSKFKKVSSDKAKTVLMHPSGHKIVIAHNSVSPSTRKQLNQLPSRYAGGGGVDEESVPANQGGGGWDAFKKDFSSAVGDMQGPETVTPAQTGADFASQYNVDPNQSTQAASDQKLSISPDERAGLNAVQSQEGPIPSDNAEQREPASVPPAPVPQANMPSQAPAEAAPPEQAPAAPQSANDQNYQKGFEDYHRDNAQKLGAEDAAWQHDLANGHVTPENYHDLFAKRDTLGKVGMLFGLLVSGAGSGLAHQSNAVLDAMNKEIENDYNAQVQSKGNAKNFLDLHRQQMLAESNIKTAGTEQQFNLAHAKSERAQAEINAQAATLMKMNRIGLHEQVLKVQAMSPGPMKDNAEKALATLAQGVEAKNFNIADVAASRAALAKMVGNGDQGNTTFLKMIPGMEGVAKDIEEKTVPGVGRAQIPVPQETRDRLTALQQYDQKAKEYVNFAGQHSNNWANLNPADRERIANQGAAMGANLQSLYRNKIKGGVYKKGEQEFIQQIIPDNPAKWSASFNAIPKVQQTINDNTNDLSTTAKSVGLSSPKQSGYPVETQQTSKSGRPMIQKNGKWYYK